jgi:hypothetical protein
VILKGSIYFNGNEKFTMNGLHGVLGLFCIMGHYTGITDELTSTKQRIFSSSRKIRKIRVFNVKFGPCWLKTRRQVSLASTEASTNGGLGLVLPKLSVFVTVTSADRRRRSKHGNKEQIVVSLEIHQQRLRVPPKGR